VSRPVDPGRHTAALEVVRAGWATTVQDAGRCGHGHLGVTGAGALDPVLAGLTDRLVGNRPGTALLETAGGLELCARGDLLVASSVERAPVHLRPGECYRVDPDPDRAWTYLAVRGGIAVDPVLGSRSRDTLGGLGPPPLTDGVVLPVGADPGTPLAADLAPLHPPARIVRLWPGPRLDWAAPGTFERVLGSGWRIGAETDRVGARLDGPTLDRAVDTELASEGLVPGAVQLPPDGRPVVMLRDHPTTGGYPVIAVVDPEDLALVAQARPGTELRFVAAAGP
jgi:biotin-dependent carboxylase-like uncharacterized protein